MFAEIFNRFLSNKSVHIRINMPYNMKCLLLSHLWCGVHQCREPVMHMSNCCLKMQKNVADVMTFIVVNLWFQSKFLNLVLLHNYFVIKKTYKIVANYNNFAIYYYRLNETENWMDQCLGRPAFITLSHHQSLSHNSLGLLKDLQLQTPEHNPNFYSAFHWNK